MLCIYSIMLYKFNILFLLPYKIMSIKGLSSSSTVKHTINHSSIYVYKHFEFIFVAFPNLYNLNFDKIITIDSPKSHNRMKRVVHFIQICQLCWQLLPIIIMLNIILA